MSLKVLWRSAYTYELFTFVWPLVKYRTCGEQQINFLLSAELRSTMVLNVDSLFEFCRTLTVIKISE